jgi:DNA polymerase III delta subunit
MAGKGNTFKAFHVAFGGEDFYLDRYIETTRQSKRRVIVLDGEDTSETQLVDLCESMSEDPRTVVIDNAQALKGGKEIRRYVEERDARDQSVILVAIVRAEKLSELWSFVAESGKRIEFKKIKPWQKDAYLSFVSAEATRGRVAVRKDAAEALYQCTGPDLYRLANEIRKLGVYVGQAGEISAKLVLEMATKTPHAEPHLIAEAALSKDMRRAMSLFSVLCLKSGEAQFGAVVFQLMKQVETTVVVRSLQDKGMEAADIASTLDVNVWRFKEAMAPVARKHDLKSLVGYMRALSKLDADVKTSSPFKRTMIEMAMLRISN